MSEIRLLQPGDEAQLEAFLLPRIESSMFLLGNARGFGLRDTGERLTGSYVAAFANGQITGVIAHFHQGNLLVQAADKDDAAALCHAVLQASQRPVGGVVGPAQQVEVLKTRLDIQAEQVQMDEVENLYRLRLGELVVPNALASGQVVGRRIEARYIELAAGWRVDYSVEALGATANTDLLIQARDHMSRACRDGDAWILEAEGQPVAFSAFNTAMREAVQVGGVWTPPALRGRGYARCAVAASLLDARAEGAELAILFTGQEHIAAQRAYLALGFEHIGDYRLLILREPQMFRLP